MPFVNLRHFDNLAYAYVNPPELQPDGLILQAADLGCGPDRVAVYPSSRGARVAVFTLPLDRENAVSNGPFLGREVSVFFERHDESDNRFLFEHESMAALSFTDYPLEHWRREHIIHSAAPFANPHTIDPVCLTGIDFSEVLITVKAASLSDIPLNLTVKNHCSTGTISKVSIIDFDDLAQGSDPPSDGPDLDPIPDAASSEDEHFVELQGGACFGEVLEAIGAPAPLIPHGDPSSAAPAASVVSRALACAPPLPLVVGGPILSKPKSVSIKLKMGFFDVVVLGAKGERLFFRLPLRRASSDPGCKGLLVANFTTATVGLIDSIAVVGPSRRPSLSVDVLAHGCPPDPSLQVPLSFASDLVLGSQTVQAQKHLHLPLSANGSTPSGTPELAMGPAPSAVQMVDANPVLVAPTVWRSASPPSVPRRSSRLVNSDSQLYVSIVDKAIQRKKKINEGSQISQHRQGELDANDLLAVALEDGRPLPTGDVHALAVSCDIPVSALDSEASPSSSHST
jgi:hypothetical protein